VRSLEPSLTRIDWLIEEKFFRIVIVDSESFIVWGLSFTCSQRD